MRTKTIFRFFSKSGIALLLSLSLTSSSRAQVIWENPKKEVYDFLARQVQKGNIQFSDLIQPISRKEIILQLTTLQDSIQKLSVIERKELAFYQKEYSEFIPAKDTLTILKKDEQDRFRLLSVRKNSFLLRADPIIGFETTQGPGQSILKRSSGFQFTEYTGGHFTFQMSFKDITETGTGIDTSKAFTPETGVVRTANAKPDRKTLNYSELTGNVTYSWNTGDISLGKDQLLNGYGQNGRMILSDKAPAYPFIRFDYQPLKWMSFNYTHAWLQSDIIDSAGTYNKGNNVYGNSREFYIPKYMASHSLSFFPLKGLTLNLGESMVYSDRLDIGYLIPIMFFKAYDQYASRYKITTGSNGQFFFQVSSRNNIPKTHLYSTLFIDEIRLASISDPKKSRNQLGFNIGASRTDILIPYLTLGLEYTRINPFVYQNLIPAQNYTSQGYSLGDWMGNNADRFLAYIKYTPAPRLKTSIQYQATRKGGAGTLDDQYFASPQPSFLFNLQNEQTQLQIKASYEWINNLYVDGSMVHSKFETFSGKPGTNSTQFQFSLRFGL